MLLSLLNSCYLFQISVTQKCILLFCFLAFLVVLFLYFQYINLIIVLHSFFYHFYYLVILSNLLQVLLLLHIQQLFHLVLVMLLALPYILDIHVYLDQHQILLDMSKISLFLLIIPHVLLVQLSLHNPSLPLFFLLLLITYYSISIFH